MFENNNSCCCGSTDCCNTTNDVELNKKNLVIDFLFLDVTVCERCKSTDKNLEEALAEVSKVLEATGIEVIVNKIYVDNEEIAKKFKFMTSPTIRINGKDIQMDYKESLCESCGALCGDDVDCRVWIYQGKEYTQPPKAMIIETILKEVYGSNIFKNEEQEYKMPVNLKKYYESMKIKKNK